MARRDSDLGWRDVFTFAFVLLGILSLLIGPILIVGLIGFWIDEGRSAFAIAGSTVWTLLFLLCLWWSGS